MTHWQLYEDALSAKNRISTLLDVTRALSSELETSALIKTIMMRAKDLLECDRCALFLVDRVTSELVSTVADGTREIRIPLATGIAGHVASTGEILNIQNAYSDSRFNREVDKATGYVTRSILCVPITDSSGKILGAVQMLNKFIEKGGIFKNEDVELLKAFSSQVIEFDLIHFRLHFEWVFLLNYRIDFEFDDLQFGCLV